jgi:hypothetical protein
VEVIAIILAFAWVPTVLGTFRLWRRYLHVRKSGDQWLLQLFCIVATLVTPGVLYISFASSVHLFGQEQPDLGPMLGAASAIIIAAVVPIMEIRMQMWINGSVADPAKPVNGEHYG